MSNVNLDNLFSQFFGKEVKMIEKPHGIDGQTHLVVDDNDETVKKISELAKTNNLRRVRYKRPDMMYTMEYMQDRLNIIGRILDNGNYQITRVSIG